MSNALSLISRVTAVPRVWRYFLLFVFSQLVVSTIVRERLTEFIRSRRKSNGKQFSLVPLASQPKRWIAALFLGHVAEIELWNDKGIMMNILNKRFKWYEDVKQRFNCDSARVKLVTDDFVFTQDLEMINAINGKEDRLFRNSDTIRRAWGTLFPDSVTVRTGAKWKRLRRVLVSAMSKLDYEVLPPSTNEVLELGMHEYVTENVQEVFLWDCFAKITFDSFHKFVYDINFNTVSGKNLQVLEDLMTIATQVSDRLLISMPIVWKLPSETNRILWDCHKRLCSFVDGYVDKRNKVFLENGAKNKKVNNLLDALIMAWHEDSNENQGKKKKKSLTREEMRAQLCAAMFGGFDTTTSSMSMIMMNLSKNIDIQEKLHAEVKDVKLATASGSELGDLPYLNSVIKETLRLNAVAPAVARIPNEDVVINGHLLKAGTNILADHEALGQRPEHWNGMQDLEQFRPERWLECEPTKGSYFPFGFGGRMCPGYKIAESQMRVILTFLSQNYIISPSEKPIKIVSSLGRTVSRDSSVVFTKRNQN